MNEWIACLTALSAAIAARQPHRFEEVVKAAYEAGASREELLTALDSARLLAQIPAAILDRAYATIHSWYWMETRRVWHGGELVPQAGSRAASGADRHQYVGRVRA